MTTIVVTRSLMAADSRVSVDTESAFRSQKKIRRFGDRIVGACGSSGAIQEFFKALEEGTQFKGIAKNSLEFAGLILDRNGIWFVDDTGAVDSIDEPFYAIGSGAGVAIGAMSLGATPLKALKVAAKWDTATGEPFTSLRLRGSVDNKKRVPKRAR